jgi:PHD/YefM family antitoxin component YafN of YafNO toxin-antitoxin module
MKDTVTCSDCIVTYICDRKPEEAVVISMEEWRSMRSLNKAGLLPELQHKQSQNSVY